MRRKKLDNSHLFMLLQTAVAIFISSQLDRNIFLKYVCKFSLPKFEEGC